MFEAAIIILFITAITTGIIKHTRYISYSCSALIFILALIKSISDNNTSWILSALILGGVLALIIIRDQKQSSSRKVIRYV